jgi:hypothetical protein
MIPLQRPCWPIRPRAHSLTQVLSLFVIFGTERYTSSAPFATYAWSRVELSAGLRGLRGLRGCRPRARASQSGLVHTRSLKFYHFLLVSAHHLSCDLVPCRAQRPTWSPTLPPPSQTWSPRLPPPCPIRPRAHSLTQVLSLLENVTRTIYLATCAWSRVEPSARARGGRRRASQSGLVHTRSLKIYHFLLENVTRTIYLATCA